MTRPFSILLPLVSGSRPMSTSAAVTYLAYCVGYSIVKVRPVAGLELILRPDRLKIGDADMICNKCGWLMLMIG